MGEIEPAASGQEKFAPDARLMVVDRHRLPRLGEDFGSTQSGGTSAYDGNVGHSDNQAKRRRGYDGKPPPRQPARPGMMSAATLR
ncbi:hypothetical protein GCM10008942_40060 [Rhizomicrobium electricum]|uniref:Uncharacterized protein n=1 Tax=Rhizomicrobium electricum TaxID=480070 RepID=A0ABN1FB63_9PROT